MLRPYILLFSLFFCACNFGGTDRQLNGHAEGADQIKIKSYKNFYDEHGRMPNKEEKKGIDKWAESW